MGPIHGKFPGRCLQVDARLISLKLLVCWLILFKVADLKYVVESFLFHRKYTQIIHKNSPFHTKHEVDRIVSRIRTTDTSNSASNRSYDQQIYFLNYSSI